MDLHKLLAQMAVNLVDAASTEDTIETISYYARSAVNSDDAGVMLVHARGLIETPTATSEDVEKAHQLQAEYSEGPCLAALEGGDAIYVVSNTLDDDRWPNWGKAAAALGYFSVISASLNTGTRRIGSLNAYSRSVDAFDEVDVEVVGLLADHATAAIAAAKTHEDLRKALDTRTLIGQAQGILMAAYDIDAMTAFGYMRRLSQDQNHKLFKVAESIVQNRQTIGREGTPHEENQPATD